MTRVPGSVTVRELRHSIDVSKLGPNSPLREILANPTRAKSRDLEHQAQVKVFEWVHTNETQYPELKRFFAVPNFSGRQGRRTARQGARLKAEGRRVGVPDMEWPLRRGGYLGLVIELKIEPNKPTEEQEGWLEHFRSEGWRVAVCTGRDVDTAAAATITVICEYFGMAR